MIFHLLYSNHGTDEFINNLISWLSFQNINSYGPKFENFDCLYEFHYVFYSKVILATQIFTFKMEPLINFQ